MAKKIIKSTLVILTRNEIQGVRSLIHKIPFNEVDEAFAIDYNSTDGTVEFFQKNGIKIIPQKKPGRFEAFKLAAEAAKGENMVFFSPDGNENPSDIPKLLKLLESGSDLAIASRFLPDAQNEEDYKIYKPRAWANRMFTFAANILWNRNRPYISDTINGYRAIGKKTFNSLSLDSQGYVVEYQMTIRAMKKGLKINEIPTIESKRIGGVSGAKAIQTGLLFLKYLIREIFIGNKF